MTPFNRNDLNSSGIRCDNNNNNNNNIILSQAAKYSSSSEREEELSTLNSLSRVHCVCFDLEPHVVFVESLNEMSEDEIMDAWYDPDECQIMIQKAKACVQGKIPDDDTRGLEHCSPEGAMQRRAQQQAASAAVLGEQLRQQALRATEQIELEDGDELIAMEYIKVNRHNRDRAIERAQEDEMEASEKVLRRPMLAMKKFSLSLRRLGSARHLVTA